MNCKKDAVAELRRYKARKMSVGSINAQLAVLADRIGLQDGTGEDCAERRALLEKQLKWVTLWLRTVEGALGALDERERTVLWKFYVDRREDYMDDLCETLFLEQSAVYRLKDRALGKYVLEMYGGEAM